MHSQSWTLDAQGNWTGLSNNGGTAQSRTHNSQNQVTQVGGATLSFDAAGNMTTDEQGRTLKYDAWNRLVKVEQNGNVISQYQYDGLKRRITEQQGVSGPQRVLYYSAGWQVIEERESGVVQAQQVWSPVYVDALILRDRNANGISGDGPGGSGLEQRHYVAHDANFNVTALIDAATGLVAERYYYQAYGRPVVLDANFVPRATGQSQFALRYLHQGGRFDWAAGYYHFRNRDLSPTLGRWLNLDPIGYEGSQWNLYEYVEGRPIDRLDPLGKVAIESTNGSSCVVHFYRSPTQPRHVGITIHFTGGFGGTAINGTSSNTCDSDYASSAPPRGSRLATNTTLSRAQCECLASSCGSWNSTPANQRTRTCDFCPRNSNWVLKCILKSCGVSYNGPRPYGWGSNTGICTKRAYQWHGNCEVTRCESYQECPDGFDNFGGRL